MLNVQDLPKNFCIGHYVPQNYWPEEDCSRDDFVEFIRAIKSGDDDAIEWCVELIGQNLGGFDAVSVVPSGTPGNESGIKKVARKLAKFTMNHKVDATLCLRRHTATSSYYEGGDRSVSTHLKSIELQSPELIRDKVVLLLDDVRTTGNSLQACKQILDKASPKSVVPLALAQTWYPDTDDPLSKFYEDLEEWMEMHYCDRMIDLKKKFDLEMEYLEHSREDDRSALQELRSFAYGD